MFTEFTRQLVDVKLSGSFQHQKNRLARFTHKHPGESKEVISSNGYLQVLLACCYTELSAQRARKFTITTSDKDFTVTVGDVEVGM